MNLENVFSLIDFTEKGKLSRYMLAFLNIVLLLMITHYCYVLTIGNYTLPDDISIRTMSEYFLQGKFLVPFILFIVVWFITDVIGTVIVNKFVAWVFGFASPIKREVIAKGSFTQIKWLKDLTRILSEDKVSRNAAWNQPIAKIQKECVKAQKFIRDTLLTSVRFAIGVIIATVAVKEFHVWLLVITVIGLIIAFYAARVFYLILELIPFFIEQYQHAAKLISQEASPKNEEHPTT